MFSFKVTSNADKIQKLLADAKQEHPRAAAAALNRTAATVRSVAVKTIADNEFLTDPWAKGLLENFQTNYRRILAETGIRTDLVH